MHPAFVMPGAAQAVPIWFVTGTTWPALRLALEPGARAFVDAAAFEPRPGRHLLLPGKAEGLAGVLFGLEAEEREKDLFLPGRLADLLPAGAYRFANAPHDARLAALAFALGSYRFARYRAAEAKEIRVVVP